MNKILEYLKDNVLITDGAMGTYYRTVKKTENEISELANIYEPDTVRQIHRQYINAGARAIKTNTFSANRSVFGDKLEEIISKACFIARSFDVFVLGDIGPIEGEDEAKQYREVIDLFFENGVTDFIFETFSNTERLFEAAEYIKSKNKDSFVLAEFAITDTGVTSTAVPADKIVNAAMECEFIDAYGFNCGIGPMYMVNIIKKTKTEGIVSACPNAGFPELINGKIEYVMNPKYFAKVLGEAVGYGVKIVGGCCGTTPEHIQLLSREITNTASVFSVEEEKNEKPKKADKNDFHKKLENGDFIYAVELDPPFNADTQKLDEGALILKRGGADIITIADSPMGKSRADSMIISSRIKRMTGIETLPHICCRDRNYVSLRSAVLGAYIEGIRSFLVVTGDPVFTDNILSGVSKNVFNFNSYSLMNIMNEMNMDIFQNDKIKFGGAVNFNVKNKNSELKRLLKKHENGAEFFLSQPVFDDETIDFISRLDKKRNYKLFGGIMPLVSYKNASFINNELPGISIPEKYINMFSADMSREQAQEIGIEIAVDTAVKMKNYVDGFYIVTPFNRCGMVCEIISRIKKRT